MKKFLWGIFFILPLTTWAQTLTVIDLTTQEPLLGVKITDRKGVNLLTDVQGRADVTPLKESDSISFSYPSFQTLIYSYEELIKMDLRVEMFIEAMGYDEVTVSANRWEQKKHDVPAKMKTISMREAAFQQPQTAADLLETSGYAFIQKSQMAGGSPMLRGFATNRVMIVVDGVRMNNAIFRSGNLQNVISIDANSLQESELLFGPGAVMYGSDAIGGVMDFRTLQPQFANGKNSVVKGSAFARYSSANKENTLHFDYNYGAKKWSFLTAFNYSDYQDLRAGTKGDSAFLRPNYVAVLNGKDSLMVNDDPSLQVRSAFSQMNTVNKIAYKPNDRNLITYSFNFSKTSDAPRYDRLILDANGDGALDNAEWYYGPQKWMMNSLNYQWKAQKKWADNLRAIAAVQHYEESRHDRRFGNSRRRNQFESVDAYSINVDLDKEISKKFSVYYGWESVFNRVGSYANRVHVTDLDTTPFNSRYPDGSAWQVHGLYGNAKFRINPKMLINGGLRYSYYRVEAKFDTAFFNFPVMETVNAKGALNGSVGMVFSPNQSTAIYFNLSTGFRAPNVDDIGKVFDSEPGNVVIPNPSLKPEYAYNGEIGFAAKIKKHLSLDGALYYTYLKDAMVRRNFTLNGQDSIYYDGVLSQVQAIQNAASAFVYGVQAGINLDLSHGFVLKSQISYQFGEEQSGTDDLYYPKNHVAPLFGRTSLSYQRKKFRSDVYVVYNGEMSNDRLPLSELSDSYVYAKDENGDPYTPAWYTLNFKMSLNFNRNISLSGGVENITDQLYRTYSSGISSPGRNYIVSLKVRF